MRKNKSKSLNNSIVSNTLKGLFFGIMSFLIFLAVFSILILKADVHKNMLFVFVLISSGLSAFIGSFTSSVSAKKNRLLNGILTTLILLVTEFVILLCFNNASLSVKIYIIIPIALVTGAIGGILGSNIRRK